MSGRARAGLAFKAERAAPPIYPQRCHGRYTGSRHGDICCAALIPTIGRGYVDLEHGILKRKPDNKQETSKKQPTIPLPPRLLAHIRRWKRLGISNQAVIEFNGKPVPRVSEGWDTLVKETVLWTGTGR